MNMSKIILVTLHATRHIQTQHRSYYTSMLSMPTFPLSDADAFTPFVQSDEAPAGHIVIAILNNAIAHYCVYCV